MKKILLMLLFSISVQFVFAQPTQAEINKMIKEANAEIDIVEEIGGGKISGNRKRRDIKKEYQNDIQLAATSIKVID
jgi:hypothetical protein